MREEADLHHYIWQLPDWTERLRWDSERCLAPLARVRLAQGRLLCRAAELGLELGQEIQASTLVEDAIHTSAVEGEHLDPASVRSSVARRLGLPSGGFTRTDRRVDGLVEILVDATTRARDPLTAERLQGWQAALFPTGFSGIRRISTGCWRTGEEPMRVVSGLPGEEHVLFVAPPSEHVPEEMARLLQWFEQRKVPEEGILFAAVAHLRLVTIHPFDDGNGRVTRAVTDMALARDEGTSTRLYSMSAQIMAERKRYYEVLELTQRGDGEITEWVLWFFACLQRAMENAFETFDVVMAKGRFWNHHGGVPLNDRQSKVMNRLLDAGPDGFVGGLSTRKYASMTKTSRATAQREIADLVEKGLLCRLPGGGRSTAYAVRWLDRTP